MMDDDLEIKDVEGYAHSQDNSYSYSKLVMLSMKKCVEASAKEMKEGHWTRKQDKFGNIQNILNPDARLEFIETVKTLKMVIGRYIDDDAKKDLEKEEENLKKKHEEHCGYEEKWWNGLHISLKTHKGKEGYVFIKGLLNDQSFYYNFFLNEKVDSFRTIFDIISKLVDRIGDFKEDLIEA